MRKISKRQQEELNQLKIMSDNEIDTSDIPEITDWSNAETGKFYRPEKQITSLANVSNKVAGTIALDLEGTLISSEKSQIPRPGLMVFLNWCNTHFKVVIYTSVTESKFREIAKKLVKLNQAPNWFPGVDYIEWDGNTKDLRFIKNVTQDKILLVDDCEMLINKKEKSQWIPINCFDPDLSQDKQTLDAEIAKDKEFERIQKKIMTEFIN